ncbi:glycolate oxidase subunit GlcF [Thioalbus denitrificans]|uniref:Glycolate oxidase iron-sulfur subunit n=1 Tax=Thioalbus denitrificans TaxID=547122 RepID=A0A369CH46_9GAMM|nr:glycolate oxidase subunit GlcF [Thioalbus denitrificans]RCX31807.1 glycolate oxidase iron-sulfur subunit [Thioalbus denitrificans]
MQTSLTAEFLATPEGREADAILRACVHCGFCTATCPTYQLLGDELDGPRGRIYQLKLMLEGVPPTRTTQLHLDRCLTCRACETTCPSGVRYARLADLGRAELEQRVPRPAGERLTRWLLRTLVPYPGRLRPFIALGRLARPLLPTALRRKVPAKRPAGPWLAAARDRRMLVLEGCVQAVATPATNAAAARVLARLGVTLIRADSAGCCGAVSTHLAAPAEGLDFMRRNIDAWWPHIEAGAEAIVVSASGCGTMVKEYGEALRNDPAYAAKAGRVAGLARDIAEVVAQEDLGRLKARAEGRKVAFHSPCSLQHGQRIRGVVESILRGAGFQLTPVPDAHLCCGSAGTYSLLQPELSGELLANKVAALQSGGPEVIATANIGCQLHIESGAAVPVRHWIELLDEVCS